MFKKIWYMIRHWYHPYPLYSFDLLTERHLKNRKGECVDCFECCRYSDYGHCKYVDTVKKRCKIYNKRKCDIWFPVSQKEIDYMTSIKPNFYCKFYFTKTQK
jgi:hypothetical protein